MVLCAALVVVVEVLVVSVEVWTMVTGEESVVVIQITVVGCRMAEQKGA